MGSSKTPKGLPRESLDLKPFKIIDALQFPVQLFTILFITQKYNMFF